MYHCVVVVSDWHGKEQPTQSCSLLLSLISVGVENLAPWKIRSFQIWGPKELMH